jgi:uncharacterized DUF497 family protein
MAAPEFEWDAAKERDNVKKHAVSFQEALTVFADPLARIFDDPDHSQEEPRAGNRTFGEATAAGRQFYRASVEDTNH